MWSRKGEEREWVILIQSVNSFKLHISESSEPYEKNSWRAVTKGWPPEQRTPIGSITRPIFYFLNVSDEEGSQRMKVYKFALENWDKNVIERDEFEVPFWGQIFRLLYTGEPTAKSSVRDEWTLDWRCMDKTECKLFALEQHFIINNNLKNKLLCKLKRDRFPHVFWF